MAHQPKWEVTTNRYVAFLDIMGFKDMVQRGSHASIYEMMKKIEAGREIIHKIDWIAKTETSTTPDTALVHTTHYSDSIMIYSKDADENSRHSFFCAVSAIYFLLLKDGIPFKGAVAFGQMTLDHDKSIFFGQPLIDAYLLHEELFFYGIVLHASAEVEACNSKSYHPPFVFYYKCPFKTGIAKHFAVFPLYLAEVDKQYQDKLKIIDESLDGLRKKTSGQLRRYIDNTEEFHKAVKEAFRQP